MEGAASPVGPRVQETKQQLRQVFGKMGRQRVDWRRGQLRGCPGNNEESVRESKGKSSPMNLVQQPG